eukprot:2509844-Lingulodinium_polyedra.AAC.1
MSARARRQRRLATSTRRRGSLAARAGSHPKGGAPACGGRLAVSRPRSRWARRGAAWAQRLA